MKSRLDPDFRDAFERLPKSVQEQARRKYQIFKENPYHNSLQFKLVKHNPPTYSVRIGENYRALGVREGDRISWYWIGTHADYDKLLSQR